jgi:hypothetical protein
MRDRCRASRERYHGKGACATTEHSGRRMQVLKQKFSRRADTMRFSKKDQEWRAAVMV